VRIFRGGVGDGYFYLTIVGFNSSYVSVLISGRDGWKEVVLALTRRFLGGGCRGLICVYDYRRFCGVQ
jgi:hypothetical protein